MAQYIHPTEYRFYLQKYPQGNTSFEEIDVEEYFKCRYVKMTGNSPTEVKNTYSEDFVEVSGKKVWTPPVDDLAYKPSEIKLSLRWRSDICEDVHVWSQKFFNYVTGQKIEWNDTFRPGRYWQLILEKAPEVTTEILYTDPKYLIVEYTFTNFGGKYYSESQLQ